MTSGPTGCSGRLLRKKRGYNENIGENAEATGMKR
jgi:hypothetical protein